MNTPHPHPFLETPRFPVCAQCRAPMLLDRVERVKRFIHVAAQELALRSHQLDRAGHVVRNAPALLTQKLGCGAQVLDRRGGRSRISSLPACPEIELSHDHALCVRCGELVDAVAPPSPAIVQRAAAEIGFAVHAYHTQLLGTCAACQAGGPQH